MGESEFVKREHFALAGSNIIIDRLILNAYPKI
jgi:hypothetical protein